MKRVKSGMRMDLRPGISFLKCWRTECVRIDICASFEYDWTRLSCAMTVEEEEASKALSRHGYI